MEKPVTEDWDYIVVGSGSAGSVIAARLSECGRHRVLLLEAGGPDHLFWMRAPLGTGQMLRREDVIWQYETEPNPELRGRRLRWPRGKTLGGSSSVNGTLFVRGDHWHYDDWAARGATGWAFDDLLPYFKKFESFAGGDPHWRGRNGPISVERLNARLPVSEAFVEACRQTGLPENEDYNAAECYGASFLQYNTKFGRRQSAAVGYLRPAKGRANLKIVTDAMVTQINVSGNRADGVSYSIGGVAHTARAGREVIISAGSIGTPHLLELSGIGNPDILRRHGIAPRVVLPGVGENLIDHLQTRVSFEARNTRGLNEIIRRPLYKYWIGAQFLFFGKGLMTTPLATAQAVVRSSPHLLRPDLKVQLHHFSGKDRMAYSKELGIDPHPGLTFGVVQLSPQSRGSLHLSGPSSDAPPSIRPNQLSHPEDVRVLTAGLRLARQVASQPALSDYIVKELRPGPDAVSDHELVEYIRDSGQTSYHPIGTCRMGIDSQAVVDPQLKVHGIERLRVADASIMPTMPASNTNAACLMIGEKAAAMILADAR
ncbi:GMC family oxidoreductase [Microvirga antarctica]|uniref:GMC family oxidoreductase n=1 Tax=Microvirga antarctica TaxID=2819233 RepID=UPI001B306D7D|nr:GMC family oxidoreductase N-terminal domain-containing protein [Microvirga antarctica]